jgi:hypothetical protein
MGRSRCRRGRQYGDEWQRQHGGGKLKPQFSGATISFVFLKRQKKMPIFIFTQKICRYLKSAALDGRLVRLMVKPPLVIIYRTNSVPVKKEDKSVTHQNCSNFVGYETKRITGGGQLQQLIDLLKPKENSSFKLRCSFSRLAFPRTNYLRGDNLIT